MKQAVFFILFSFVIYFSVFAQKAETERKYFEEAYQEINGMLTDQKPVSFKRAVFLSENAYLNNTLSYSAFDLAIKSTAFYIQQTAENLKLKHPKEKPLSINYAIFQYITDTTYRVRGDKIYRFLPYRYDFSDFNGQKDWRKMFVTKLLEEGTGNCRSLPYFYKLLADECKVEANLALAPNHIYIKHRDVGKREEGWHRRMYNVELTNGSFPMDGWIVASGYITLDGIRNALFMDTLSAKQSVGLCLLDLAKGYERKFGVKGVFVTKCVEAVLKVQPFNINALLLKAELLKEQYDKNKTPANFQALETHCGNLVKWGYREMPIEMYLNWLFEIRAKSNSFDSVHYKPKKFDTQKYNPMKDDKKLNIKMHTLTDGRFDEFPEHAETTYVGSAVYDVYNKKIVGFIKRDTLYSETLLEPDVVSRWLSLDPIVHPYESPYTAFANNPIYFIDPNGTTVGDYISQKTGKVLGSDNIDDKKIYSVERVDGHSPDDDFSSVPQDQKISSYKYWSKPQEQACTDIKVNSFLGIEWDEEYKSTQTIDPIYKITELSLNKEQFLDRAYWIFGESRGAFADAYAHTIANARKAGPSSTGIVPYSSDAALMTDMMKHRYPTTGEIKSLYADFKAGKIGGNYRDFYKNMSSFNNLQLKLPESTGIFRALVQQNLGISKDPTKGAIGWLGGGAPGRINPIGESYKTSVKMTDSKGFNHYFHKFK